MSQEKANDIKPEAVENVKSEEEFEEVSVRPVSFYIACAIAIIVLIASGIAMYVFYPFQQKVAGEWYNSELGMALSSKQDNWEMTIPNYQNVAGFSLVYQGRWDNKGVNIYDGQDVKVQVVLDKKKVASKEIEALKVKSELYKEVADTSSELRLEYTEKGISQLFNTKKVDSYFHFVLSPQSVIKNKKELYLNSAYFSETRLLFIESD